MPLLVDPRRLRRALAAVPGLPAEYALEPLAGQGVAHDHIRLVGTGLLARVPRVSQMGLAAAENLAYQAACFRRMAPSGRTPALFAVLPAGDDLPMGALLVREIAGRPARVPGDLPAIAATLAAIHRMPLPRDRAPLGDDPDPVGGTWRVIRAQADFFAAAAPAPEVAAALEAELEWAAGFCAAAAASDQPRTLVGTDTHPGNFLVDAGGDAFFVDLEKALYGAPAIDAAHATLPTSVMWSAADAQPVAAEAVLAFERAWLAGLPGGLAQRIRPWVRPLRRLTWLRSMSWFARWRVVSRREGGWSAAALDPATASHVAGRVALFFSPGMVDRARSEWTGPGALPDP
ncbi:MAG: phosphotransferase family protein [Alphaproteobacteria bacterium]